MSKERESSHQEPLFDLGELARRAVAEKPWVGAPLAYTTDYYDPADLDAAMDRYITQYGSFGCLPRSHMWRRIYADVSVVTVDHAMAKFVADTRCADADHVHELLPNALMHQAICPACRWHAIGGEDEVVVAWHDHAMPGWRTLPVLPSTLRGDEKKQKAGAAAWVAKHYPAEWQIPGAPVITERTKGATRPVERRSPFGGYDIATANLSI